MPSRNAPCPCGSGKKYKKCCLARDEQRAAEPRPAAPTVPQLAPEGCNFTPGLIAEIIVSPGDDPRWRDLGLSRYAIAKLRVGERAVADRALQRAIERHRRGWTIEKLRAMDTDEIRDRLARLGVDVDRDLVAPAATRWSAWALADEWVERDTFTGSDEDADFARLAACELWRRLLPDRPSIEMLDDWMQEGYMLEAAKRVPAACDVWWRVWEVVRTRLSPEMRTAQQANPVFTGLQSLGNWFQEFERHLGNAAIKNARYAELDRQLCEQWIAQFTEESELSQQNFRRSLATCIFRLGRADEALAVLHAAVERWPVDAWGYIALADAHLHDYPTNPGIPRDTAAARSWLEKGLAAVAADERGRAHLEERLGWLKAQEPP